ncbi:MAG TPA: metal ABC transporter permease [Chloroflexota bacterium]|nr:metal ABC transporter permease [Chloroflexota bacterium]
MDALFTQAYMQNALLTGTIVAVLAGLVGFFVVLRGVSFATHALAQMGFAGAAGAVLIGVDPLWGLLVFAVGGALGLGLLGAREHGRDAITALLLVAALGTGALFLTLNSSYATAAFTLLFGTIVGISREQVWLTAALALGCLAALAALYRPLLLATVNPELAAARGVPLRLVGVLFLVVVGATAAATVPTVGALLIFSLVVGPAGAAVHLARRPLTAMLLAGAFGLLATWAGIVVAYNTGWPVGFLISAAVGLLYLAARLADGRLTRPTQGARSTAATSIDGRPAGTAPAR